jgi:GTP-binding protein
MIIDDIKIKISAGSGGSGVVAFSKTKMVLGPTGGNGGKGGDIYFEGVSDLTALRQFRYKKEINAENGENGNSRLNDGKDGKDIVLQMPVGTVATNLNNGIVFEITKIGQKELAAKGGKGGKGNFLFRSSINTTPKQFQPGKPGESFEIRLELKLIADVGFIGLPNVGKSSLLNELTNAKSKVANYAFTTLEPNLGAYYDLILADIPGLIEGASEGKGLGIKFLRHIERTSVLFHFISSDSPTPLQDYKTVRKELENHNKILLEKEEYIFLSKSDIATQENIKKIQKEFKKSLKKEATPISIIDLESITEVKKILNKISDNKKIIKI